MDPFLEGFQVILDNQVQNTKAGYYVYTPFQLDDSEHVVLVNRGWLAARSRSKNWSAANYVQKAWWKLKRLLKKYRRQVCY